MEVTNCRHQPLFPCTYYLPVLRSMYNNWSLKSERCQLLYVWLFILHRVILLIVKRLIATIKPFKPTRSIYLLRSLVPNEVEKGWNQFYSNPQSLSTYNVSICAPNQILVTDSLAVYLWDLNGYKVA